MKKKYDTAVVFLYATGREEILPESFRKGIPYSTISTWRKTDYSKYEGHEFRYFFDEAIKKAELVNHYRSLKKLLRGILRTWLLLSPALKPLIRDAKKDPAMRENILRAIRTMGM